MRRHGVSFDEAVKSARHSEGVPYVRGSNLHDTLAPSPWVGRWSHLVAGGATLLDVACGSGRHVRWFHSRGCSVTGIDRDAAAVEPLRDIAHEVVVADIENGPWPFAAGRRFDAVVVTNYLWRALLPLIVGAVNERGVLIYETFAAGNETVGRPSNSHFLLRHGELLDATRELRVIAYEDGFETAPDRFVQRIVAVRDSDSADALRYPLTPGAGG